MDAGIAGHCGIVASARALVVISSNGTLSSRHQLEIIAHAMGLNETGPPVIHTSVLGFSSPSAHYYGHVLPQIWPAIREDQARHIAALFRTCSSPFWIHASDQVLLAQTRAIVERIPPRQQRSLAAADLGVSVSSAANYITVEV
jgi:hypothetical protein